MMKILSTIIVLALLSSCSTSRLDRIREQKQYIQPVSSTNPYNASNLLISKMMKQSEEFNNFIRYSGPPRAVLITKSRFSNPKEVALYYPNNQYYVANRHFLNRDNYRWDVIGPFETDWRVRRNIPNENKSVILNVNGDNLMFKGSKPKHIKKRKRKVILPIVPPEPKIIIKEVEVPVRITEEEQEIIEKKKSNDPLDIYMVKMGSPINTDLQALLLSKGYASRDNNRDILHTVKSEKEKFIAVVNWYTQNTDNTPQVQIANPNIEDIHNLSIGTKIRIPYELAKEFKRMPLEAVYKK